MSAITYLVPTCGRVKYLKSALDSLEVQTAPWRIIGFSNGATDGSAKLLSDFCEAHGGRFFGSDEFHDDGGGHSGQVLLDAWGGQGYAAMLHDDDMCHPTRTARLLECADSNAADLIVTGMWTFHDGQEPTALNGEPTTDSVWGCDPSRWHEGIGSVVGNTTTPTTAFNHRYLDVPQPEGFTSGAQDTLVWLTAARMGLDIRYLPEPLYYYRLHPTQSSATFYTRVPNFTEEVERIHREADAL